jgi:hypothetical protein
MTVDGEPPMAPEPLDRRPLVERVGMAAIAAAVATLFGGVAAASFVSGELFLAAMAAVGTLMTAWAGIRTLVRG